MKQLAIITLLIFISLIFILYFLNNYQKNRLTNSEIQKLALCLKEKGVVLYGTYYCPHCQEQKKLFGDAFKYINYIECTQERQKCLDNNIYSVPTWIFPNGLRLSGVQSIEDLKKAAGCD